MTEEIKEPESLAEAFDDKLATYRTTLQKYESTVNEYQASMDFLTFMINNFGMRASEETVLRYAKVHDEELNYYEQNLVYPALILITDSLHLILFKLVEVSSIKEAIFKTLDELKSTTRYHVITENSQHRRSIDLKSKMLDEIEFISNNLVRMYGDESL